MVKSTIAPDAASVDLRIEGTFTAVQLEDLISDLAVVRGRLCPEVARAVADLDRKVSVEDDPDFQLRLLNDGRIRLWIRNRGLGWLVFNLPVRNACAMRDYLISNTPADRTSLEFFGEQDAHGGTSH